jgi:hypothetical protein
METSTMIGSTGVTLLLLAFFLNLFGFLSQQKAPYLLLNILGAGLAAYASWMIQFMPFVVLECTWLLVSIAGLFRLRKA